MVSGTVTVRVTGQGGVGTETPCARDGHQGPGLLGLVPYSVHRQCWEVCKGRMQSVLGPPKAQIQDATFWWKVSPDVKGHSPSACPHSPYYALSAPILCYITLAPNTECHAPTQPSAEFAAPSLRLKALKLCGFLRRKFSSPVSSHPPLPIAWCFPAFLSLLGFAPDFWCLGAFPPSIKNRIWEL